MDELIARLKTCTGPDWRLDRDILNAVGQVRRVSRLGINGRSFGSYRYFGPKSDPFGKGSTPPSPTKDATSRAKWMKKLAQIKGEKADG